MDRSIAVMGFNHYSAGERFLNPPTRVRKLDRGVMIGALLLAFAVGLGIALRNSQSADRAVPVEHRLAP